MTVERIESFLDVLAARVSIRQFRPDPVPEDIITALVEASRRAPTSSDLQAYSVIRVTDPFAREELARLAGKQKHVVEAPVFLAFCADLSRVDEAAALSGTPPATDTLEMTIVAVIDAALVGMAAAMTAESMGFGTVMIGGLRNDPLPVARVLGLPPHSFAVFGLCVGWALERPSQKPRLPTGMVVHHDRHGGTRLSGDADGDMAPVVTEWAARAARTAAAPRRPDLRAHLEALGFGVR